MAIDVLSKSMDVTAVDVNKYEIGVMQKDDKGNLVQRRIVGAELEALLKASKVFEQNK